MYNINCCTRCGQAFDMVEAECAEDKSGTINDLKGEFCPLCYQDLVDQRSQRF